MKAMQIGFLLLLLQSPLVQADYYSKDGSKPYHTAVNTVCGYFDLNAYGNNYGEVTITVWPNPKRNPRAYAMATLSSEAAASIDRSLNCICVTEHFVGERSHQREDGSYYYNFKIQPALGLSACSKRAK